MLQAVAMNILNGTDIPHQRHAQFALTMGLQLALRFFSQHLMPKHRRDWEPVLKQHANVSWDDLDWCAHLFIASEAILQRSSSAYLKPSLCSSMQQTDISQDQPACNDIQLPCMCPSAVSTEMRAWLWADTGKSSSAGSEALRSAGHGCLPLACLAINLWPCHMMTVQQPGAMLYTPCRELIRKTMSQV